jgi:hypothetical protein
MEVTINADVKAVAEFMQERLPACHLTAVASGLAAIAPLLWGHYPSEELRVLRLLSSPISDCDLPLLLTSNE